jgi:hypothetical protein
MVKVHKYTDSEFCAPSSGPFKSIFTILPLSNRGSFVLSYSRAGHFASKWWIIETDETRGCLRKGHSAPTRKQTRILQRVKITTPTASSLLSQKQRKPPSQCSHPFPCGVVPCSSKRRPCSRMEAGLSTLFLGSTEVDKSAPAVGYRYNSHRASQQTSSWPPVTTWRRAGDLRLSIPSSLSLCPSSSNHITGDTRTIAAEDAVCVLCSFWHSMGYKHRHEKVRLVRDRQMCDV